MAIDTQTTPVSKAMFRVGWITTLLPVPVFLISGAMKLSQTVTVGEGFAHLGYDASLAIPLGIVEIACTVLYVVPQTAVLGAILLTDYLGGATATHVRIGEPFFGQVLIGVVVWLGLFLRDPRLRALIPLRR